MFLVYECLRGQSATNAAAWLARASSQAKGVTCTSTEPLAESAADSLDALSTTQVATTVTALQLLMPYWQQSQRWLRRSAVGMQQRAVADTYLVAFAVQVCAAQGLHQVSVPNKRQQTVPYAHYTVHSCPPGGVCGTGSCGAGPPPGLGLLAPHCQGSPRRLRWALRCPGDLQHLCGQQQQQQQRHVLHNPQITICTRCIEPMRPGLLQSPLEPSS